MARKVAILALLLAHGAFSAKVVSDFEGGFHMLGNQIDVLRNMVAAPVLKEPVTGMQRAARPMALGPVGDNISVGMAPPTPNRTLTGMQRSFKPMGLSDFDGNSSVQPASPMSMELGLGFPGTLGSPRASWPAIPADAANVDFGGPDAITLERFNGGEPHENVLTFKPPTGGMSLGWPMANALIFDWDKTLGNQRTLGDSDENDERALLIKAILDFCADNEIKVYIVSAATPAPDIAHVLITHVFKGPRGNADFARVFSSDRNDILRNGTGQFKTSNELRFRIFGGRELYDTLAKANIWTDMSSALDGLPSVMMVDDCESATVSTSGFHFLSEAKAEVMAYFYKNQGLLTAHQLRQLLNFLRSTA